MLFSIMLRIPLICTGCLLKFGEVYALVRSAFGKVVKKILSKSFDLKLFN